MKIRRSLPKVRDLDALGLAALLACGARDSGRGGWRGARAVGAAVEVDRAVLVEDGEAAAAALVVALVGGDEAVVVDPAARVGLARDAASSFPVRSMTPSFSVSMPVEIDRPSREVARSTLPVARSTMTMWLFSCSVTHGLVEALMSTNSGSGSSGATGGKAGEVDHRRRAQSTAPVACGR